MKHPRRLFVVIARGERQFTTGDYNRATRLARDLASEMQWDVQVSDEQGVCYTVDAHGVTNTLRSVRD